MSKRIKVIGSTLVGLSTVVGSIFALTKYKSNQRHQQTVPPFFNGIAPYVFAHRGGLARRPEHTILAFDDAQAHGVDGFETDVRLSRDGTLIVFHDGDVDRVTDGSGRVADHHLDELKALDAGYHFTDINGAHPYRQHPDAKILTFDEMLKLYPDMYINVDLKDHPDSPEGQRVPKIIYDIIQENQAMSRVLVTSFYATQIERFREISRGLVAVGASQKEVTEAFVKRMIGFGHTYTPRAHTFQIPTAFYGIPLARRAFIHWLISRNIVPGFYVINSVDEMIDLYEMGAHTIVTDRVDLAEQFKNRIKPILE